MRIKLQLFLAISRLIILKCDIQKYSLHLVTLYSLRAQRLLYLFDESIFRRVSSFFVETLLYYMTIEFMGI